MTAAKILAHNLKRWRKTRGVTQQQLAELAELDYKHCQKIESGKWPGVQLQTIERLAKALETEIAELLTVPR